MSQQYPGPPQPPHPSQQPEPWGPPPKKRLSTGAIVGLSLGGVFVFLVVLGAVVGEKKPDDGKPSGKEVTASQTTTPTPTSAPATSAPATTTAPATRTPSAEPSTKKAETGKLPSFVGKGLQYAQDEAQSLGFYSLRSHDSLGRSRNQVLDRNWKVCFQTPAPGTHPTDVVIDFGTVKLEETCPKKDTGRQPEVEAGGTMPDFRGKSVKAARAALPSNESITVTDAAEDRMILMESNWKVCTQSPAAGTTIDGRPITFTAVKFEESCP
ncbi:PASTA domain-containing protein [Streptomyces sp. NPDC048623]|uniref:PASTA domain-containing protein n=1 Tax=Streptomyces sp. NPDC048623 TaxID=3155761 RepID=UPI00343D73A9